jgi:16S rRNA (guanine966-N2)-methyltransferase
MRIIGGLAAGRLLQVPAGFDVRPMPDKVKLAVFNSLGDRPDQARVLDLFAGTGALGLEMLSRGARQLVSVERTERHARSYRHNLAASGLNPALVELRVQDVFTLIPQFRAQGRRFDLIIADPPYGPKNVGRRSESPAQLLLDHPDLPALLESGGRLIVGHARLDRLELPAQWEEAKELKHGDTVIRFLELPGTRAARQAAADADVKEVAPPEPLSHETP